MRKQDLEEILALEKKMYAKLNETLWITEELVQAVDRQDQISVQMLLSARQQPVLELQELRAAAKLKRCDLSGGDEEEFDRMFSGARPQTPAEAAVTDRLAVNHRLLERLVEQDRSINQRLCKERSYYLTHKRK